MALFVVPAARLERTLLGRDILTEMDLNIGQWRGLLELAYDLDARLPGDLPGPGTTEDLRPGTRAPAVALLISTTAGTVDDAVAAACVRVESAAERSGVSVLPTAWRGGAEAGRLTDLARRLSRAVDGIWTVGLAFDEVRLLADVADVPVWNVSSERWAPLTVLADLMTMIDESGLPPRRLCAAVAEGVDPAVVNSLTIAGAMLGMEIRLSERVAATLREDVEVAARGIGARTGGRLRATPGAGGGEDGADFVYVGQTLTAPGRIEEAGELERRREENAVLALCAALRASLGLGDLGR